MTTPYVLLPYQQAWLADASPVRVAEKSRRIGWSWAAACESTLEASRVNGCDTWYVGYNHDMAQEFIRDCAFWARSFHVAAGDVEESIFEDDNPDKGILAYTVNFASGFRITALSSRPTNLRGKEGHVIIDEAAFHDDLPGLIKAAMAVKMWGRGARIDIISTHNGTESYFNTIVEETRAGKRPYSVHRCTLDDALEQGLYQRICLVNDWVWTQEAENEWRSQLFKEYSDDAAEELLCVPARSGGAYLPRDLIERQMRPGQVFRLVMEEGFVNWPESARVGHIEQWCREHLSVALAALPKEQLHFLGEDFGRVSDRTVLVPSYLAQDLTRKTPFAVECLNTPFEAQRQVLFFILDRLPRFVKGAFDATGNGAYLAEVAAQRYGQERIEQVSMTEKWYAEQLPPFKAALEDKQCELIRDADHLIDLSALKVVNGLPKLPKAKTDSASGGPQRHGDAAIAYALSYYASRLPVADYGYAPAPKRDVKNVVRDVRVTSGLKSTRGGLL